MIRKYPDLDKFYQAYKKRLAAIGDDFPIESEDKIVELGSSSGFMTIPIARNYPKTENITVDLAENDLKQLEQTAEQENLENVQTCQSDARNPDEIKDNSVDLVISNFFLSEIISRNKLKNIFKEMARILHSVGRSIHSDLLRKHQSRDQHLLKYQRTNSRLELY